MQVDQFDFELPEDLIALRPVEPRSASRLLHVGQSFIRDREFSSVTEVLNSGDVLVLNNTRVIPAALTGIRPARNEGGGGPVSVDMNLHQQMVAAEASKTCWRAFARPAKRLQAGDLIDFGEGLQGKIIARHGAEVEIEFPHDLDTFAKLIQEAGNMPLPPYIARKRQQDARDLLDYQTVFARKEGSVAAPTAGLHFTPEVLKSLSDMGVRIVEVTLHVGAGTFLPVTSEDTEHHKMHAEWGDVSQQTADLINEAKRSGNKIVCVGTTSLRLLESAAQNGELHAFRDTTDIFITPGFQFMIADCLITNFHLPRSTLFMLVSAFSGLEKMQQAYEHAIEAGYRFYSYGDACYLERHD